MFAVGGGSAKGHLPWQSNTDRKHKNLSTVLTYHTLCKAIINHWELVKYLFFLWAEGGEKQATGSRIQIRTINGEDDKTIPWDSIKNSTTAQEKVIYQFLAKLNGRQVPFTEIQRPDRQRKVSSLQVWRNKVPRSKVWSQELRKREEQRGRESITLQLASLRQGQVEAEEKNRKPWSTGGKWKKILQMQFWQQTPLTHYLWETR